MATKKEGGGFFSRAFNKVKSVFTRNKQASAGAKKGMGGNG